MHFTMHHLNIHILIYQRVFFFFDNVTKTKPDKMEYFLVFLLLFIYKLHNPDEQQTQKERKVCLLILLNANYTLQRISIKTHFCSKQIEYI